MIIQIFKIETLELCTIRHKRGLLTYIADELGRHLSSDLSIEQLINYLPVDEYCWINRKGK